MFPSTENGKVIALHEFVKLEPHEIEIFVVRPVKKIISVLSHVVCNQYY